jgi:putative hydrolase of the HAD superfamily
MKKKAIIYDLDNTLYSVRTIGTELFAPLFEIISDGGFRDEIDKIKVDLMSKPFQVVAEKYRFGEALKQSCVDLLRQLTFQGKIETYEDYGEIKSITADRFLVTTGFHRL